jgi:hypothetical protein
MSAIWFTPSLGGRRPLAAVLAGVALSVSVQSAQGIHVLEPAPTDAGAR